MLKKNKLVICLGITCFVVMATAYHAAAQNQPVVKIQTPNTAAFEKFTSVPVDLFTGTPDIALPLHTLTYGSIQVPVALRYHAAAVQAAVHPGWVGAGWDLQAGGSITRTVRGGVDEFFTTSNSSGMIGFNAYYPWPGQPASGSGSTLVEASDWNTTNRLVYYFSIQNNVSSDVQADEFSFSFLGHSGKFYYEGSQGWKVVSDENVRVQLNVAPNDFLSSDQVNDAIHQYTGKVESNFNNEAVQIRAFNSFTLTTADGTKYVFGGANAMEFNSEFAASSSGPTFVANTWLLTKIIDPQQNEVTFTYRRSYPSCELFCGRAAIDFGCSAVSGGGFFGPTGAALQGETGNVNTNSYSGYFHWPMYLSTIKSPNETITLSGSVASCMRFTNTQFLSLEGGTASAQYVKELLNNNLGNLQWEKLDKIVVQNVRSRVYKQFQFTYNNVSTQRLALNTFAQLDNQGVVIGQYDFQYNNLAALPLYDGNRSDHWGFFNNKDMSGIDIHNAYTYRETDIGYVTTGLLTRITYPAKGYTQFDWEAHDFSQYVSRDRSSLLAYNGTPYAGGSRIKEIRSYLADGSLAYDKKYYYKRAYTNGANVASLASSGILNGLPQYVFDIQNRPSAQGHAVYSIHQEYLNPYASYSYNGLGSYIGYDEVVEAEADGSYTRNVFTSYGADYNGVSHFDQAPAGSLGWVATDNYVPHTDMTRERGKLAASLLYSTGNVLLKKTINTYRADVGRFDQYLKRVELSSAKFNLNCAAEALILATANKVYSYTYYPIKQEVTNYDQQGNNPVVETTTFAYNANNLVSVKSMVNSKGETLTQNLTYTTEGSDNISNQMVSAHQLNYVIQDYTTKNNSPLRLTKTMYFSPLAGLYKPQYIQQQNGTNALETRQQFYQYDAHGNILEQSKTGDVHEVYLWAYNFQYPVARIEGSTYNVVSTYVTQAQIDAACNSDAALRALFATLRTSLPTALVTSYTYSPVYGITSITDQQGRTNYYDYDGFGRLVAIRDQDNKVIKRMCYNYSGQQGDCSLYYNTAQSGTATKSCSEGYQGTLVNYVVPAQTYTAASQVAADQLALNDVAANQQANADWLGTCQLLYYNVQQSGTYTKTCITGQTGSSVTYTVAARKYSSTVSQAAADQLAVEDVQANGQLYANNQGVCTCNLTTIVLVNNVGAAVANYRAVLTAANGTTTTYLFPSSGSSTVTTTFVSGTYGIGFAPPAGSQSGSTNYTFSYSQGPDGQSATGSSASFPNVQVSCTLTLTIR